MTLATWTDSDRKEVLTLIIEMLGLDPDTATWGEIEEKLALTIEFADRYEGVLR